MNLNNKITTCFLIVIATIYITSCGSQMQLKIPGASYPGSLRFEELTRTDYKILGEVTGTGKATYTGLWPIPIFWYSASDEKYGDITDWKLWNFSFGESSLAKKIAVYKAIESNPEADLLLEPRYRVIKKSWGIWHTEVWVEVKGKAIKIKTDGEK